MTRRLSQWQFQPGSPDDDEVHFLCIDVAHSHVLGPGDTLDLARSFAEEVSCFPLPDAGLDFTVVAEVNHELRELDAPFIEKR